MDPKVYAANGSDPRTTLALFGGPINHSALQRLFGLTRRLIENAGLPANVLARRTVNGFGRYHAATAHRIEMIKREDAIGFSIAHAPPPSTDVIPDGWFQGGTTIEGFLIGGKTKFFPPVPQTIVSVIAEIASIFPVQYGYQFVMDQMYGPMFHSVGMFYEHMRRKDVPPLPTVERTRTSNWSNRREKALAAGKLRDVFPLNVLSEIHSKHRMNDVPLFEWINADRSRGKLHSITPTLSAWMVPDAQCIELGDLFEAAGLLA